MRNIIQVVTKKLNELQENREKWNLEEHVVHTDRNIQNIQKPISQIKDLVESLNKRLDEVEERIYELENRSSGPQRGWLRE